MMNVDDYGEIVNGPYTYKGIAGRLKEGESVIIGWTDEKYTQKEEIEMDKDDELLKVLDKLNNKLDKIATNMEKGILEEEEKKKCVSIAKKT